MKKKKKIDFLIKKTIQKANERFSLHNINLEINVNINKNLIYLDSVSNGDNNHCIINLNYINNKPIFLENFELDIQYILFHEISHCVLGKNFIKNEKINWIIPLTTKEQKYFNNKLKILTNLSYNQNVTKIANPFIVYHEIYADLESLFFIFNQNKDLKPILDLSEKRINSFKFNLISSNYGTGFAIPYFLDLIEKNTVNISEEEIHKITQKGLIDYLQFIDKNYNFIIKD